MPRPDRLRWLRLRQRLAVPLMLAPALILVLGLFGGGLVYGLQTSLGVQPRLGQLTPSLDAYTSLLVDGRYTGQVWAALGLSLWLSAASTLISALIALGAALLLRGVRAGPLATLSALLFQATLPVPHLVAAVAALFVLGQSGLVSRGLAAAGWVGGPADFPVLVRDRWGWGVIITYVWKEVPFIGLVVLAALRGRTPDAEAMARNLGANAWQRFRHVTWPSISGALLAACALVFAYVFGAYEVPQVLGVRFPQALPVLAVRLFNDPDLGARDQAFALMMLIALAGLTLLAAYSALARRDRTGNI